MRVVSLLPSATETVALLGGASSLVGRSHACDFPPGLGRVPVLTVPRGASDPSTGPLFTLDEGLLEELRPDLILTQDLCAVCAIDLEGVERVAQRLDSTPGVLALSPETIEDVLDDITRVGASMGLEARARDEVVRLSERLFRAQEHVNAYEQGPVVGFMEWTDPVFVAGHWNVQLIERAGGRHPLNETVADDNAGAASGLQQGQRRAGKSIAVSPEVFAASQPEQLVIAPCGLNLEQTRVEAARLAEQEWFRALPAVGANRVALVDGSQMFNRPGPRLVDAFEWLVGWLQGRPELMPAGFPWEELRLCYCRFPLPLRSLR